MYYVYILRCEGGSLYTGITTDLKRRFLQHSGKKTGGAKATKISTPLRYEIAWRAGDRSNASKLEFAIKKLSHSQKENIIANGLKDYEPVSISDVGDLILSI